MLVGAAGADCGEDCTSPPAPTVSLEAKAFLETT